MKQWLDGKVASHGFSRRVEFVSTGSASDMEPDTGCVFYDQATVNGRTIPVTGVLQRMFFDRASASDDLVKVRASLREFAMRYFLRVSESRRPETAYDTKGQQHAEALQGFGFSQWLYKSLPGLEVGRFPDADASAIIDLRDLGRAYEWILVRGKMYNYLLPMRPFGLNGFQMAIPMKAEVAGFISAPLVINQDDPAPGVLGRYGVSFAMPALATSGSLLGFGPGLFDPCLHQMFFELASDGVITAEARLVVNEPDGILRLPLDPVEPTMELLNRMTFGVTAPVGTLMGAIPWPLRGVTFDPVLPSVDVANVLTAGAASHLGVSRDDLIQMFLEKHFETDYFVLLNVLRMYRRVPDWTGDVPGWAQTGVI